MSRAPETPISSRHIEICRSHDSLEVEQARLTWPIHSVGFDEPRIDKKRPRTISWVVQSSREKEPAVLRAVLSFVSSTLAPALPPLAIIQRAAEHSVRDGAVDEKTGTVL